jgi:alpha-amylase
MGQASAPIVARVRPWRRLAIAAAATIALSCAPATPTATTPTLGSAVPASASAVTTTTSAACAPAPVPAAPKHWWNDRVFYEVFVRSFRDSNGDGIGDLNGVTDRLDYLGDLGITGLWLMPVAEAASYHGYDVVDYRNIERDYGTLADFKRLVAEAHKRGIAVIDDLVLNHTSIDHPWFRDARTPGSAHDDWYVWSASDPGYAGPSGQAVWHKTGNRWYYGVFSESMPDLNLRNPEVTAELEGVARYWLVQLGVDGFRLDAAMHLVEEGQKQINTPATLNWLADFHAAVRADKPDSLLVGEVFAGGGIAGRYVPESADMTFDFDLAGATVAALQTKQPAPLASALQQATANWPSNQEGTFLTNHDQDRVMSQLNGDVAAAKLAAFVLMTTPGVPFVYYGEEIGMRGTKPDERIRTAMQWTAEAPAGGFSSHRPWEPLQDDWETINVAAETGAPDSLLSTYRSLIRRRRLTPMLRDGATIPVTATGGVVAWLRTDADGTVLLVANLGAQATIDYGLAVDAAPLCSGMAALLIDAVNGARDTVVIPPTVNDRGGFTGYAPIASLPPRSGFIVALASPR